MCLFFLLLSLLSPLRVCESDTRWTDRRTEQPCSRASVCALCAVGALVRSSRCAQECLCPRSPLANVPALALGGGTNRFRASHSFINSFARLRCLPWPSVLVRSTLAVGLSSPPPLALLVPQCLCLCPPSVCSLSSSCPPTFLFFSLFFFFFPLSLFLFLPSFFRSPFPFALLFPHALLPSSFLSFLVASVSAIAVISETKKK